MDVLEGVVVGEIKTFYSEIGGALPGLFLYILLYFLLSSGVCLSELDEIHVVRQGLQLREDQRGSLLILLGLFRERHCLGSWVWLITVVHHQFLVDLRP